MWFSVFSIIKEWFIERFLKLMETAFRDPRSYFKNYSNISRDDAISRASMIWDQINGKNLRENIIGTKYHAQLIMEKTENHMVKRILLRKI